MTGNALIEQKISALPPEADVHSVDQLAKNAPQ
jgi:hypothetical protein